MMKNRKFFVLWAAMTVLALTLTGCMGATNRPEATPEVTLAPVTTEMPQVTSAPTPNVTPEATGSASTAPESSASAQPTGAASEPFDWMSQGEQVEQRIDQLSEISSSRVVVNGDAALVAVEFSNQYQGELTQRIRDMVAGEVMAADPNIKSVAVTAEAEDVKSVGDLANKIKNGTAVQDLKDDIDKIIRNVTTLR